MNIPWEIVVSTQRFEQVVKAWNTTIVACDTETHPDHLLGISLSNGRGAIYIPLKHYNKETGLFETYADEGLLSQIRSWLPRWELIGHNFTYDKGQIAAHLGLTTHWKADTRIMWHLASAPSGPRPYGLKDAQTEILGWDKRGDEQLSVNVKKYGGSLKKGEHYLADIEVLGKYACLDAYSTYLIYTHHIPFFKAHDYWPMLCTIMGYNELLELNTRLGVRVDRASLLATHEGLQLAKEAALKRFNKELKDEIESLEQDWADRKASQYKREYNKTWYASHPEKWKRFNINSDSDKRELFYDKLSQTPSDYTGKGLPKVDGDVIKRWILPFVGDYLKYEKANTLSTNFTRSYLECSVNDSRLHPGFNIAGTVSYRLSGFKPYLLNAPFDERAVMQNLQVDEGYIGVHADLSAIEPTITAHYSEDSSLLKVFRDGLGDIYLDLALELFPNDKELQDGYNPRIPVSRTVKERFAKQRKVAKVIQLAVQYTGTGHTVSKSLTKEGIITDFWQADSYVRSYWHKFKAVAEFNAKLRELNRKQGYLRNVIGRIIRVPDPEYKDLSNRFIQSSAHDVLILWVLEIYRLCKGEGIEIRPILLDCHDSTSNQVRMDNVEVVKEIYRSALETVNSRLGLCVKAKAEIKTFTTLAGLKGEE